MRIGDLRVHRLQFRENLPLLYVVAQRRVDLLDCTAWPKLRLTCARAATGPALLTVAIRLPLTGEVWKPATAAADALAVLLAYR